MKKKLALCLGILGVLCGFVFGTNDQPATAVQCDATFLGFQAWYSGLDMKSCSGQDAGVINSDAYKNDDGMAKLIWTIVLNIMLDISIAIGILATSFVVYGGYLYIFSEGSPDKVAKGKTTIKNAVIGIIIAVAAGVIVGTIKIILTAP